MDGIAENLVEINPLQMIIYGDYAVEYLILLTIHSFDYVNSIGFWGLFNTIPHFRFVCWNGIPHVQYVAVFAFALVGRR